MEGLKRFTKIEIWAEIITWVIILLGAIFVHFTPQSQLDNATLIYFSGLLLIFALGYYYIVNKFFSYNKRQWIKNVGNVILIGILIHISGSFGINLITLFFMPIIAAMFIQGTIDSLLIAIIAIVIISFEIIVGQNSLLTTATSSYSPLWSVISILLVAIYTRFLAYQIHHEKNLKEEAKQELIAARTKMVEFESLEKEFISMTAHQLYTPLSVIRGFLSMMLQGDTGPITSTQKQYLDESYHYTIRMIHLVHELLNISHIDSGHYELKPKPLDIHDTIKDVITEVEPIAAKRHISLSLHQPPGDLPDVLADITKTPEIFLNLIDNAIKYSSPDKQVDITLHVIHRQNRPFVQVDIQDYGVGIPKDEQQFVFQRFFRATNILSLDNQGTGLGLFIAKRLVEKQGGSLAFTSEENKATTFSVTLPVAIHLDKSADKRS